MKVGVLANIQNSMFSAGNANASLAIAELVRELGYEVDLIQTSLSGKTWWEDCNTLSKFWKVVPVDKAEGYDLVIEVGKAFLNKERREKMGKVCVWVARHPFLLQELESSLFPTMLTPKREFDGLKEVWIFDKCVEAEAGDGGIQVLETISRLPVRVIPFVWTPTPATTHLKEVGLPPWTKSQEGDWLVHITEKNTTNASSAVIPLVILREAKRQGIPISTFFAHNTDVLLKSKFFVENVLNHCTGGEVGLSGECLGRQRAIEWLRQPGSCVLSHIRFGLVRPVLLDLAWVGIPTVHNSEVLRQIGSGLERYFYPGNEIGAACDAFRRLIEDAKGGSGAFGAENIKDIRVKILSEYSPLSERARAGWLQVLRPFIGEPPVVAAAPQAPVVAAAPQAPVVAAAPQAPVVAAAPASEAIVETKEASPSQPPPPPPKVKDPSEPFRVGFCDMWSDFNPSYNFFTLMLQEAGKHHNPPLKIVGAPATPEDDIVIFGPFGESWKALPADLPKIHFTGENTDPVKGAGVKLNLGFRHLDLVGENYLRFPLWILEIDWFNADLEQIANPKPIPLTRCTRVYPSEVAQKKKFCAFVVSNPCNPVRNSAFHWLSDYKPVDSAGRLFNNIGPEIFAGAGGGGGELKKFEFFKDYKFALTYENDAARGYTTEKYLHAKAAGCIPIYWGDPVFERDFNLAGCIDARKFRTQEELIEAVKAVDEDEREWLRRFAVPALDPYKVEWCRRTMAECAGRLFNLGGLAPTFIPRFIGAEDCSGGLATGATATGATAAGATAAGAAATEQVAAATEQVAAATVLEVPIVVTTVTRRFLPSLQQWLASFGTQTHALPTLKAHVFLASDIPEGSFNALKETFTFATFERLPDSTLPAGLSFADFPDYWSPEHYAWKLWVYNELAHRPSMAGKMIFYTDAGSLLCKWPKDWMMKAQKEGVCLLEDAREENKRWCSPEFVRALAVTEEELKGQQRLGGLVIFRAGSAAAKSLFGQAYEWSKRRDVIAGPKWAGIGPDGKPLGHRHDQSILSILSLRQGTATVPLDTVYCDHSLRRTFTTGRSIYVHRGNFKVKVPFCNGIDDAYVINLDRRKDRMDRLWKSHPELEDRVGRWPAVDGKALTLTPALARLLKPNDFFWKKAVTGCALSHLGLWWKLAKDAPDIQNYLILEDDVKFKTGWEEAWNAAVEGGKVPEDYDIIYLGGVLPPNRENYEGFCKERVNSAFCRVAENTVWGQSPFEPTRYFHFCAYAYILSKRGAQKVIELLREKGGYWTSADHILCNPVTVLKSYVFDPMVAGCYQDDDPVYANSNFNDFSRIDGFDSDLWNNDERFGEGEIKEALERVSATGAAPINFEAALRDASHPPVKEEVIGKDTLKEEIKVEKAAGAVATAAAATVKSSYKGLPARLLCLKDHDVQFSKLYEYEWLYNLFGRPSMIEVEKVDVTSPPPLDCSGGHPIVIVQRPFVAAATSMLERWSSFGAKFKILHLSDEFGTDCLDMYALEGCVSVLRNYYREDISSNKVTTIPLGYHWTLMEGSKNSLRQTPKLPFRGLVWSFFGTNWNARAELFEPLIRYPKNLTHRVKFLKDWNDEEELPREEYISSLLDTVFVPCPDGMNPETFRFYEALECGCVPVLVRTEKNKKWLNVIAEKLKLMSMSNWMEVAHFMNELMNNTDLLEKYRNTVLIYWNTWKEELKGDVERWLKE